MHKLLTKKQRLFSGFTLIELLVVIAIIGVLASIVLASLNSARKKSRDARRITDIKQIQLALELYFDGKNNQYPAGSTTCSSSVLYGLEALASNNYIPQVPRDPLSSGSNKCYAYATKSASDVTSYHLGASLEETGNPALMADKDAAAGSYTGGVDFSGLSAAPSAAGDACTGTAGDAQPNGTEVCYDVVP